MSPVKRSPSLTLRVRVILARVENKSGHDEQWLPLERVDGKVLQFTTQVRAVRVRQTDALNQQNHEQVLLGINPSLSTERSAVPVAAGGKHRRHSLRLLDNGPAKTEAHAGDKAAGQVSGLNLRHRQHTLRRDDLRGLPAPAVEHLLIE